MKLRDLTVLTPGERLWLDRLRRGESQAQAGYRLGIPERRYLQHERDRRPIPFKLPRIKPTAAEQCALARRRDGRSLAVLSGVLGGVSHVTFLGWEMAADHRLLAAWRAAGYRFGMD